MRIVFINLHANEMLVKTLPKMVFRQSVAIKHGYLLRYLLDREDVEVCSYINDRGFSLMHNGNKFVLNFLQLFKFWEHQYVLKKNGITPSAITVIKNAAEIRSDDIVIFYRFYQEQLRGLNEINAFKALCMIHFGGDRKEAAILNGIHTDCVFNESNLSEHCEIYKKLYRINAPWIVLPFVYEKRFCIKKPFNERQNKAFAVGTITYKEHQEFLETYGNSCTQPLRKQIKDNANYLSDYVDCYSSDYMEDAKMMKAAKQELPFIGFIKRLINRFRTGQQKKYYSFNMVDKFNDYKMCIVGEEVLGIPGIGFVEGMACGCAYIGLKSKMYSDYGMEEGVHYIGYDGSLEDLKRVIQHYQQPENQEKLQNIAEAGHQFVLQNFNGNRVAERLIDRIFEQYQKIAK